MISIAELSTIFSNIKNASKANPQSVAKRKNRESAPEDSIDFDFDIESANDPVPVFSAGVSQHYSIEKFLKKYGQYFPKGKNSITYFIDAWYHGFIEFKMQTGGRFNDRFCNIGLVDDWSLDQMDRKEEIDFLDLFYTWQDLTKEQNCFENFPEILSSKLKELFPTCKLQQTLDSLSLNVVESFLFIRSIAQFIQKGSREYMEIPQFKKYCKTKEYLRISNLLESEKHVFIQEGFWKISKDPFHGGNEIILGTKSLSLVMEVEQETEQKIVSNDFILVKAEEVKTVELYYDAQTQKSVDRLQTILKHVPQEEMQKILCLFEGSSGAGKSELAKNIFKELGIPFIQISSLASKYVGESESKLKRIFLVDYPKLVKQYGRVGIIWDEFDQIAFKKTDAERSSDNINNAIVSYLLNVLDNMEQCLMICTMNNSKNRVEQAILRRFTFQIQFGVPDEAARKKIWMSKNNEGFWQQDPHLLAQLARYPFTGSDISNVCNKARLFKYMAGQEVSLLMEVMEEQLVIAQKSRYDFDYVGSPIGFRNVG